MILTFIVSQICQKVKHKALTLYKSDSLCYNGSIKSGKVIIGYDPERTYLYAKLINAGFSLVHKPTVIYSEDGKRTMKGNVDAELVLHAAAVEYGNYDRAIIITSDGDFACLLDFLTQNKG